MEKCTTCEAEVENITVCRACLKDKCRSCCYQQHHLHTSKLIEKICNSCSEVLESIKTFLNEYSIKWNSTSEIGLRWMETSGAKRFMEENEGHVDSYSRIPISEEDQQLIEKDILIGRTDPDTFMWEYNEMFSRIVDENFRKNLEKVVRAYCGRNQRIGYCEGLNFIGLWLLVFLDENHAFWTLSYLIEEWLLPDLYIGNKRGNSLNGFYIESTVIANLIEQLVPELKNTGIPPDEFSNLFSLELLISLFIGVVDLKSLVFLWDKLMTEGAISLVRGTVSLIALSHEDLNNGIHPLQLLKKLSNTQIFPIFQQTYERLTPKISLEKVQKLRVQARNFRAKQWETCEKVVISRLEKHSNFTKDEIEAMQRLFKQFLKQKRQDRRVNSFRRRTVYNPVKELSEEEVDIGVTRVEFIEIVTRLNINIVESASALFDQFDEDKSGYLDFRELVMCLSIISKGSFEEKLRICFNAYDIDKSGYLQKSEMEELLESLLKPYIEIDKCEIRESLAEIEAKMMGLVDENEMFSFEDFLVSVKSDPFLYSCFAEETENEEIRLPSMREVVEERRISKYENRMGTAKCLRCLIF